MIRYIDNKSTDPYFNLALEQYAFEHLERENSYLILWQNRNAIVVGQYQNTYAEINSKFVEENGISVVRRLSGGGAVYHDMGNLNYTIITGAGQPGSLDFSAFCRPIIDMLQSYGVNACFNGRNDMTVNGKKFSGNAQYVRGGRVLHHGTILFHSDLAMLDGALKAVRDKMESKGIASVRSRVCNLSDFLGEDWSITRLKQEITSAVGKSGSMEEYTLTDTDIAEIKQLRTEKYRTWEWNYGKSRDFKIHKVRRIDSVGIVELDMDAVNGCIHEICFSGDFFSRDGLHSLTARLIGCRLEKDSLKKRLEGMDVAAGIEKMTAEQLIALLTE